MEFVITLRSCLSYLVQLVKKLIDHKEITNVFFLNCTTRIKFKVYEGTTIEEFDIIAPSDQYLALKVSEILLH